MHIIYLRVRGELLVVPGKTKHTPTKPTGTTGPFTLSAAGIDHHQIKFPTSKVEIEKMIAKQFVADAGKMPVALAPFSNLKPNAERDLDFTVTCGDGRDRLLELAEFAPLQSLGVSYENAPRQLSIQDTAELALQLVYRKSRRQGGPERLLLLYKTSDFFFIAPPVQELMRRRLNAKKPNFDAVYFLSPHDLEQGSAFEVWPGKEHSMFRSFSDSGLSNLRMTRVYPDQLEKRKTGNGFFFRPKVDK